MFEMPAFDVEGEIKAAPITKNYMLVGTAFDYAFRVVISKLNYKLVKNFPIIARWATTHATPEIAIQATIIGTDKERKEYIDRFEVMRQEYVADKIVIDELLPMCIPLAKMDSIFRGGIELTNEEIFTSDKGDIQDLQNLVNLIDPKLFKAKHQCILNPVFDGGEVGGADADLIIDSELTDIKTTKNLRRSNKEQWRQLIGYWLLDVKENNRYGQFAQGYTRESYYGKAEDAPYFDNEVEAKFYRLVDGKEQFNLSDKGEDWIWIEGKGMPNSKLTKLCIYYSRHGLLWTFPAPEPSQINWKEVNKALKRYGRTTQ